MFSAAHQWMTPFDLQISNGYYLDGMILLKDRLQRDDFAIYCRMEINQHPDYNQRSSVHPEISNGNFEVHIAVLALEGSCRSRTGLFPMNIIKATLNQFPQLAILLVTIYVYRWCRLVTCGRATYRVRR
jgi:hypothetical protein